MASQSEKAQRHRDRQALRSPHAIGGFGVPPGYLNRKARRAAQSTKGKREAAQRDEDLAALLASASGKTKER